MVERHLLVHYRGCMTSQNPAEKFNTALTWLQALAHRAAAAGVRRAVVLEAVDGAVPDAALALALAAGDDCLWLGPQPHQGVAAIPAEQAERALGTECGLLVIDLHAGIMPDALGMVAGCLRGGGVLLLLCPPLEQWSQWPEPGRARLAVHGYDDNDVGMRFITRLAEGLQRDPEVRVVAPGKPLPPLPEVTMPASLPSAPAPYRTADQARAARAVLRVARGHRRRPLVLTADRGRGKSAALGLAAGELLRDGVSRVVVTAPRRAAVDAVFRHAWQQWAEAVTDGDSLRSDEAVLSWAEPAALLESPQAADLVLVDEAAGIPVPVLEALLRRYARIVFSTTVHGYEGTGRGFDIRFRAVLDALAPRWRRLVLEQPVRYPRDDAVERLVFDLLLLDAAAAPAGQLAQASLSTVTCERLDRDGLVRDEQRLRQVFGLLVQAHYRTRPQDLRNLLDSPNVSVHVLLHQGQVVAAALMAREGGFDEATAEAVWQGRRRPRGHLLPQSLSAHMGVADAPLESMSRIMRIAVHPAATGRGLGRYLLRQCMRAAGSEGCGVVGSSFGATPGLLDFWQRCGFAGAGIGLRRDPASGEYAAVVVRALNAAGRRLVRVARARFAQSLPWLLADPLRTLDPRVALALLGGVKPADALKASREDYAQARHFAFSQARYEAFLPALWRVTVAGLARPAARARLGSQQAELLVRRALQRQPAEMIVAAMGLKGRAALMTQLRAAFAVLVDEFESENRGALDGISTL